MNIQKTTQLAPAQIRQIMELENRAFARDGLENHAYLSGDLNLHKEMPCFFLGYEEDALVAFLSVFAPEEGQAEIMAVTDPLWERRGLFHSLYAEALAAVKQAGIHTLLLAVEKKSVSGNRLLQAFPGRTADHSEYRMELLANAEAPGRIAELGQAERLNDLTKHVFQEIDESANGRIGDETYLNLLATSETRKGYLFVWEGSYVGAFVIGLEENGVFIYGVAIKKEYQGRGIAKYMMKQAITLALAGAPKVSLEVDSQNPPALKLYRNCGFRPVFEVDYYRIQI